MSILKKINFKFNWGLFLLSTAVLIWVGEDLLHAINYGEISTSTSNIRYIIYEKSPLSFIFNIATKTTLWLGALIYIIGLIINLEKDNFTKK